MSNTLICTVGASMLSNFRNNEHLMELFEKGKTEEISNYLLELNKDPESYRGFGAEINSVASIIKKGFLIKRKNIYFLISDTEDGKKIGNILKNYFEKSSISFENVEVKISKKLDDSNQHEFKIHGLRNLIKNMSEIIKKHYGEVIINATGGYKAQIAFALALGQGLNVPVYYRFERFPEVIELDPLPIELDETIYFSIRELFEEIESEDGIIPYKKIESLYKSIPKKAKIFFDEVPIDHEKYIAISPMGQIYLESIENKFYFLAQKIEPQKRKGELKFISSKKEGHSKEIIEKYELKKLFENFEYINKVHVSRGNERERSGKPKIKIRGENLIIIFHTKNGMLHLEAETTARDERELEIIKIKLKEYLNKTF